MAKRIQRKRTAGWRRPENAVIVDRTSRWGNPFTVVEHGREGAVMLFELALLAGKDKLPFTIADVKRELRGKDLACFCKLSETCHGDILLRIAAED